MSKSSQLIKNEPRWRTVLRKPVGILGIIAGITLMLPGLRLVQVIADPGTGSAHGMGYAWTLHQNLSPRYETWARWWLEQKRGEVLSIDNIAGTEWPLFGSVFFLEATESLQSRWKAAGETEPLAYGRGAVEAATDLVLHPSSAAWVKQHWGENYLTHENAFYRMLVIRAIIAHHHITGSTAHVDLLRSQVEGLVREIDASPAGLLDDYPNQCFPGDIAATIAAIRRAGPILGADYDAFIARSLRGFTGKNAGKLGLPPYFAVRKTGLPMDDSRGCSNSYLLISTPVAWPAQAKDWYELYEKHFWQNDWLTAGWREFPHGGENWYFDVDAGPVMDGIGFAAAAFGTGAARMNGRFDHSWPLEVETIALGCPMPGGRLLIPRLLSKATDAPFLGEASVLYCLTRTPAAEVDSVPVRKSLPGIVWAALAVYLGIGSWLIWRGVQRLFRKVANQRSETSF